VDLDVVVLLLAREMGIDVSALAKEAYTNLASREVGKMRPKQSDAIM
jgi:hypothetical protein